MLADRASASVRLVSDAHRIFLLTDRTASFPPHVAVYDHVLRQQGTLSYMLANLFPYVGFMAAGFDGKSRDSAGKE